ncbi:MAG: sigma-54-dependent transcriptional regulator [Planctomycetota bacterium]|jgi:two-component system nitrogen regulation response regulator GlnG
MSRILIIDDEPAIGWSLRELLRDSGHDVTIASSAEEALAIAGQFSPEAVLLDVRLPGVDGISAIDDLRGCCGHVPIIVMTAFGNLETAVRAVDAGAFDYLTKPFDLDEAATLVQRALASAAHNSDQTDHGIISDDDPIIGSSPGMQRIFKQIALVARSDVPVLITGESGTGKELVARAIHRHGPRQDAPFVPVNPAAMSESSLEVELFGFARGVSPATTSARKGLFERASGGTLLLDEIGDVPLPVQIKLLRAIERQEILPVGASSTKSVDVRVIAVTSRELGPLIESGDFREDLFFRLGVVSIELPPLRTRGEDIPELARHFLSRATVGKPTKELSPAALCELAARTWPGNVRELRNTVEHAALMTAGSTIDVADLPAPEVTAGGRDASSSEPLLRETMRWIEDRLSQFDGSESEASLYDDFLLTIEPTLLTAALSHCQGNRAAAARLLGLHRATLRQKLRSHGLDGDRE